MCELAWFIHRESPVFCWSAPREFPGVLMPLKSGLKPALNWEMPAISGTPGRLENPWGKFTVSFLKFRSVSWTEVILALSSAKASQKALCVIKLSFLFWYIYIRKPSSKLFYQNLLLPSILINEVPSNSNQRDSIYFIRYVISLTENQENQVQVYI